MAFAATAVTSDQVPVLDESILAELRMALGEAKLLELISLFADKAKTMMADIETASQTGDFDRLRELAHDTKSNAGNLGMQRLDSVARGLEQICREGRYSEAAAMVDLLRPRLEEALARLRALFPCCAACNKSSGKPGNPTEGGARRPASRYRETFTQAPLFSALGTIACDTLFRQARVHQWPSGRTLFVEGDPVDVFYGVVDGWVKVMRGDEAGRETVLQVAGPGQLLAEPAALVLDEYPASAETVSKATVISFPAQVLRAELAGKPDVAMAVISSLVRRVVALTDEMHRRQNRNSAERVAEFLLSLATQCGSGCTVHLPYDKTLVAARLGMTPESFSRALQALRKVGVTSVGKDVSVADCNALRRFLDA